jgi:hypothetical protein
VGGERLAMVCWSFQVALPDKTSPTVLTAPICTAPGMRWGLRLDCEETSFTRHCVQVRLRGFGGVVVGTCSLVVFTAGGHVETDCV